MTDTVFRDTYPPLRAIDNGDGTYSIAAYGITPPPGLTDSVFMRITPALKAINNGDGTYLVKIVEA